MYVVIAALFAIIMGEACIIENIISSKQVIESKKNTGWLELVYNATLFVIIIVIIIKEFHRDASLKENFRAALRCFPVISNKICWKITKRVVLNENETRVYNMYCKM